MLAIGLGTEPVRTGADGMQAMELVTDVDAKELMGALLLIRLST